jgi:RNA polymerase sigma factor (sigma-70 family)
MSPSAFDTTQWSFVAAARDGSSLAAREAFDGLARRYWQPLYAYVRRRGYSIHETEDLVQEFFARFIEKDYLQSVSADRGRFRSFLLACLKHFLADERDKQQAQKRGGGRKLLSIDAGLLEETLLPRVAAVPSPDAAYDRAWAIAVLDESLQRLEEEYARQGKGALFAALKPRLEGAEDLPYAALAAQLSLAEPALRKAAQRLRSRYRECVRQVIGASLTPEESVEDELRHLFAALG